MADYGDDEDMEGMTYHDRLEFWGVEVPPNKVVNIEFGETDEELIHLTQARSTRSSVRGIAFGGRAARRLRRHLAQLLRRVCTMCRARCSPAVPRFARCFAAHKAHSCGSEIWARKRWSGVSALTALRRSARFQVALGDKPGDEPAAVSLVVKGQSTFIGTLRKAKCDQFSVRARAAARSRHGSCDGLPELTGSPVPRSSILRWASRLGSSTPASPPSTSPAGARC